MTRLSPEEEQRFQEFLAQARAGSRQAFQELIRPFQQVLRFRARRSMQRRLKGKISDSDLCQITYLKSFENLNQFQGNTAEEFSCWLLGILDHVRQKEQEAFHRQARDICREMPLWRVEKELVNGPFPPADEQDSFRLAAWRELPYEYQKVIRWRYRDKCSFDEIGHRLGRSADAAKHLFYRAMRELKVITRRHERE
jgi:RNA polymerase sigma factor (sigma-70 family)